MNWLVKWLVVAACLAQVNVARSAFDPATSGLPRYETKYYVIYSDLNRAGVAETTIRLTRMAELYAERTRGFSGTISRKFPFILFKSDDDYQAAGGPTGSDGVFDGKTLMAVAGETLDARTWHVVQHEGFHQFADAVIRGNLPAWISEGMAEYFGEGLFTGDDFVTGIIPQWRLKRIQHTFSAKKFKPLDVMMAMSLDRWNEDFRITNYDQAWSMVQFLAHGEGGRYQPAFIVFMNALGNGKSSADAWRIAFGDTRGFEQHWKEYWTNLPDNPTDSLYRQATVATLTSYLARCWTQHQTFDSIEQLSTAASGNQLQCAPDELLPKSLLAATMADVGKRMKNGDMYSLGRDADQKQPTIVCAASDGSKVVGRFKLGADRVLKVIVDETSVAAARTKE